MAQALFASAGRLAREFLAFAGRRAYGAAALVTAAALLDGISLLLLVPLIDVMIGPGGGGRLQTASAALFSALGLATPLARLSALLALFSVLIVLRAVVQRARDVALTVVQVGFVEQRRLAVIDALAAAPWPLVVRLRHARITHAMSGDIQRIAQALFFLMQMVTAATMLVIQAALALYLSPPLALIAFALLAAMGGVLVPVLHRTRALGGHVTRANLTLLNTTTQFLGGLKLAISQNLQGPFVAEFRTTLRDLTLQQIENTRRNSGSRVALTTLSGLVGVVLVLIGFGVFHLAAPILVALLAVIARMAAPVGQLQQGAQQFVFALPAYEELAGLEAELRAEAQPAAGAAPFPEGDIVFDHVSYTHGDGRGVTDLSLTVHAGECLGIAGASGAGKTTFADLLAGLIAPQAGTIRIGEAPFDAARCAGLRAHLAYVPQDPFLFHDSLRKNLSWAAPQADEAALWQALEDVGAGDLARKIGLDSVVGERGTLISGGERQRIGLARALLRRPRLLILDEATSAIDLAGERAILARLLARKPRPTVIIIAHRPESLALCDRVLTFAQGKTVEGPPVSSALSST